MGKKSGKPPAAPALVATANKQAELSKAAATDRMNANRYTQVGPEGSSNQWITDPATGQVTNKTTMGGQPQQLYDALMGGASGNLKSFQDQYWGSGGGAAQQPGMVPGGGGGGYFASSSGGGMAGAPGLYDDDARTGVGGVGGGIQKDLDYSGLGAMPTVDEKARNEVQNALYARQTGYLDPQFQQGEAALRTRLSNQGLVPGTAAYDRAYANAAQEKERAYAGARNDSIIGGGAEQQRLLQMGLALRGQGKSEVDTQGTFHNAAQDQRAQQLLEDIGQQRAANAQTTSAGINASASSANAALANQAAMARLGLDTRKQQFDEITGLAGGANQFLPKFTTSQGNMGDYSAPDIYGATKDQYAADLDRYNASRAKSGGIMSAIGGIGGAVLGNTIAPGIGTTLGAKLGSGLGGSLSDERLKSNIQYAGQTPGGHNIYDYDIFGHRERGVMAQEVKKFLPEAVNKGRDGFLRVDYSKVK